MLDPQPAIQASDEEKILKEMAVLVSRLERISADSIWAHRSSGLRGSLLRIIEDWEKRVQPGSRRYSPADLKEITRLIEAGYYLLENAAREY